MFKFQKVFAGSSLSLFALLSQKKEIAQALSKS